MKKILILLSVFALLIVTTGHAQDYQGVYNHLNRLCHMYLGRGDLPELQTWVDQIVKGQVRMEEVVSGIINSKEANDRRASLIASDTATTTDETSTTEDTTATDTAAVAWPPRPPLPPGPGFFPGPGFAPAAVLLPPPGPPPGLGLPLSPVEGLGQ